MAATSLKRETILRGGVEAPEQLSVYPLILGPVAPLTAGLSLASLGRRSLCLHGDLAAVGVFARLIPGLQASQVLLGGRPIRTSRVKGVICFQDGQGRIGKLAADMNDRGDKGLTLEQPLETWDPKRRLMPDHRGGQ